MEYLNYAGLTRYDSKIKNFINEKVDEKLDAPSTIVNGKVIRIDEYGNTVCGEAASPAEIAEATESWLDAHVSGGSTIAVDSSLTVSGAAADAESAGKVAVIQNTQPTENYNRIWVKPEDVEYSIPSYAEHQELESRVDGLDENIDTINDILHGEAYSYEPEYTLVRGKYVDKASEYKSSDSYSMTSDIPLKKGDVITFHTRAGEACALAKSLGNNFYTAIVYDTEATDEEADYRYVATENMNVVLCEHRYYVINVEDTPALYNVVVHSRREGGLIAIQNTQPLEDTNKIWIKDSPEEEYVVPLYDEFNELKSAISQIYGGVLGVVDLSSADQHFYISANGTINPSNNWNAVIIAELEKAKTITAVLGTNDEAFLGIAFYNSNAKLSSETFISGAAIGTSGAVLSANVPSTAVCAVISTRPASYVNYHAEIIYDSFDIIDPILPYSKSFVTVGFEQGSVDSSTGFEKNNTKRIRSTTYIRKSEFLYMICDTNHKIWFYEYTEPNEASYTGHYEIGNTREVLKNTDLHSGTSYVRVVVVNTDSTTNISPTDTTGFMCIKDTFRSMADEESELNLEKAFPKYAYKTLSISFEQGTINSSGQEATNNNRIRSVEYIHSSGFNEIICDGKHCLWYFEYATPDVSGFIKGTSGVTNFKIKPTDLDSKTRYIRIVVTNNPATTAINPTDDTGFVCYADMIGESISVVSEETVNKIKTDALVENVGAYPRPVFTVPSATTGSDYTIIGQKFVKFTGGSDDLTTEAGTITYREYGNGFDKSPTVGEKQIYHYFGHCNTVDYCAENGCLIMGNGSGAYDLPGKIFIIPDFENILENAQANAELTLDNTNALIIDCTAYNLGTKFNVLWGEKNGTINNIAYLITATFGKSTSAPDAGDIGIIRRILLGMGSNQLTYGQYISGQSSDEFNGTFNILDTFTQEGTAYKDCCQGACYVNGEIVSAIGHNEMILWRMNVSDGKIKRKVYKQKVYNESGVAGTNGSTGVCTDGNHVYTGVTSVGIWAIDF